MTTESSTTRPYVPPTITPVAGKILTLLRQMHVANGADRSEPLRHVIHTAYNCLHTRWGRTIDGTDTELLEVVDPFWQARVSWFGMDLMKRMKERDGAIFVGGIIHERRALASFCRHLAVKFEMNFRHLNALLTADNTDLAALYKLGAFHQVRYYFSFPRLESRENIREGLADALASAEALMMRSELENMNADIACGSDVVIALGALLLHLDVRAGTAALPG